MNETLINYLKRQGFSVFYIDNKAIGYKHKENVYNAVCRDYRRFVFLEWDANLNYPSVRVYVCDNKSKEGTRELIGYPYAGTIKDFIYGFKECYIKKYGYARWYFRPIIKPFFKYLRAREIQGVAYSM